jgi:hypothetical protein
MLYQIVCTVAVLTSLHGKPTGSQQKLVFQLTQSDVESLADDWGTDYPHTRQFYADEHMARDSEFDALACENIQDLVEAVAGQ